MHKFPTGFLFGSATSAHQVEGHNHNDWTQWEQTHAESYAKNAGPKSNYGQGPTPVWDEIEAEAKDPQNYLSGAAAEHYERYEQDLALAAELGLNAYRFSVEWSRVEPEPGRYDEAAVRHYAAMAEASRAAGQEPMVTLWHFTLPVWAAELGGFNSAEVVQRFIEYAKVMGRALQPHVRLIATLNEPEVSAAMGYLRGQWPPGKISVKEYRHVRRGMVRAHKGAYLALKKLNPKFEIGICHSHTLFESANPLLRPLAVIAGRVVNDYFLNRTNHMVDWLGVQYYLRHEIGAKRIGRKSDLGWELFPEGIALVLKHLRRYHKPLYVTESGLADGADRYRAEYIEKSLAGIAEALSHGVDCRGYFHWSLLDNFEWHEGYWPKFGYAVDRKTQARTIRPSARRYAEIIAKIHRSSQSPSRGRGLSHFE